MCSCIFQHTKLYLLILNMILDLMLGNFHCLKVSEKVLYMAIKVIFQIIRSLVSMAQKLELAMTCISFDHVLNFLSLYWAIEAFSCYVYFSLTGLAKAFWPGRSQCIEKDMFTFYLDGAHTRKSIEVYYMCYRV